MASAPVWSSDPSSLKVAIAIALHRLKNTQQQASSSAETDSERWKKKAKERKREIRRLREELRLLEDGKASQVVPEIASCRCNFFDGCGSLKSSDNGSRDHWIDDVLRRRSLTEFDEENEIERLGTSVDFLVELADGISLKGNCIHLIFLSVAWKILLLRTSIKFLSNLLVQGELTLPFLQFSIKQ
ncbi:hypothetical protein AXF42_Ash001871 [Apostasia shenzhenica]|uniref:Uncharacterized protein n=1 Tax=Apostasia shenzhenica TaxID=1088818 RepID=A0A2I0ABH0_9ASPA|nr:hypothetical protein AXF42_Ash001871 [Apostasia shenzhenica]